jgi:hypothetical protein
MPKGCPVCAPDHRGGKGDDCDHWCHRAGAEDWDSEVPGGE